MEEFFEESKPNETPVVTSSETPAEEPKKEKPTTVSFSQYAMWMKCPFRWKLSYIDYLSPFDASVNTIFGDAIHIPLQRYLTDLYSKGATEADKTDIYLEFLKVFDEGVSKLKVATDAQEKMISPEDLDEMGLVTPSILDEFRNDGKNILSEVMSPTVRRKHFPSKIYEIVGTELPLVVPIRNGRINFKAYLDVVLKNKSTGKTLILDLKTSSWGWNKYQKQDRTKMDQLLLYKRFYSMVHNIPLNDVETEFFIMKRKLLDDVAYPQQRIQRLPPADGKMSIKAVETSFAEFINDCFTPDGYPNKEKQFIKNPDKGKKNCKYCPFKTMINPKTGEKYCNGKSDVE